MTVVTYIYIFFWNIHFKMLLKNCMWQWQFLSENNLSGITFNLLLLLFLNLQYLIHITNRFIKGKLKFFSPTKHCPDIY